MDYILIALAESIFRGTCNQYGYDISKEDESGVLDKNFFAFLVEASQNVSKLLNVEPAEVIETYAVGFAKDQNIRNDLMKCYAGWAIKQAEEANAV